MSVYEYIRGWRVGASRIIFRRNSDVELQKDVLNTYLKLYKGTVSPDSKKLPIMDERSEFD